jgi:type I restriction enzyme R subunit
VDGQSGVSEAQWEVIALEALVEQEWEHIPGVAIAPGTDGGRTSWADLVLPSRTLARMRALNPHVPSDYLAQALAKIIEPTSQDAIAENYRLHQILTKGYRGSATPTATAWSRARPSGW